MANFVAVCVFCVLSAGHLPCFAHNEFLTVQAAAAAKDGDGDVKFYTKLPASLKMSSEYYNNDEYERMDEGKHSDDEDERRQPVARQSDADDDKVPETNNNDSQDVDDSYETTRRQQLAAARSKRSVDLDDKFFTKKLFEQYGDGENMTIEGFERLLEQLGLFQKQIQQQHQHVHSHAHSHTHEPATGTNERPSIDTNQSSSRLAHAKEASSKNGLEAAHKHTSEKSRCLSSSELLNALSDGQYDSVSSSSSNNSNNNATDLPTPLPLGLFEKACPALVYQLAHPKRNSASCISLVDEEDTHLEDNHTLDMADQELLMPATRNMFHVWVYSTVSILIISLCGLLGVAVIPVMGKSYYQQLIQFLVALAVGTLCGDAFIHLIPHAMMGAHTHADDKDSEHNANIWKGFAGMLLLIVFFITERTLNMIAEWRKYAQSRSQMPARVKAMMEADGGENNVVGEKLCKHKYSTYPYCYGEIATETQDNLHQHNHHERPQIIDEEKPLTCNSTNCVAVTNRIPTTMHNEIEKKANNEEWKMNETVINNTKKPVDGSDVPLNDTESYAVIMHDHDVKHHGHGHSHSHHDHLSPDSMSSVAWMVIMGDGLHNFTDGMAIGAAFTASIAGGFSTTIAVFCHELPHEMGDFAVLLKAGMSAKQAIFYNLLSSVLCLFGMVFGVNFGSTPEAYSWMFMATAGIFFYIGLVDMMQELPSNLSIKHGALKQYSLQTAGLLTGCGIMLIIALYENDLENLFTRS
ncbi:zinc transporter foi isoform X2 [Trichogramma pretiosum]|nr:zinc transporter foi isoform X2 [Trichogramma pretiosum]